MHLRAHVAIAFPIKLHHCHVQCTMHLHTGTCSPVFGINLMSATVSLLRSVWYRVVAGCKVPPGPMRGSLMIPWGLIAKWSLLSTTAVYSL